MKFEAFMARVDKLHREQPSRRYGQILMVELFPERPILADGLRGGAGDPYYKQHKEDCGEALAFLAEQYKD